MYYLLIWLFIIGEVIFCESQYVPPSNIQHLAEVLNISSSSDQPSILSYSKEVINEHNSDIIIEELVQTTTKEELMSIDEEITTTEPVDTSTENSKIKDGSPLVITTLSPKADEIGTVVTSIKSIVNITLDEGSNIGSDGLKSSNVSLQVSTEAPTKEVTSVPKKEADPSLIRPSVVPKKEADPSTLYPSVVGKKGADPSSIKPSATGRKGADPSTLIPSVVGKKGADPTLIKPSAIGRKGADPNSLVPSVHARKGVIYEDGNDSESLKNSTIPIEILSKSNETNIKEENKSDAKTQPTTSNIKSSLPVSNEGDKANSSKSSTVPASMGAHKYTPVIKPVPVSTNGSSIEVEEVEEPSTVEEIHMKPTAATDIYGQSLEIEMIVEEKSSSSGIIIGVILLLTLVTAVIFMGYRHFKEAWMKRHYSRMDFLVEGMYDM